MNATNKPTTAHDPADMLATLRIAKTEPRMGGIGGVWVTGTIGDFSFEALAFADHAACEGYELGDSRISKLSLRNRRTRECVACFDRGWDREPATDDARVAVDLLAAGLAESIFNK